jgi:hypothetical protein
MINISVLLLLLPSSVMASEDKGQRTELTGEERESRAMIPLLRQLVSKGHHLQRQGCKSDARIQGLQQEVDKLNVSNVQRLQVEEEALDLRVGGPSTAISCRQGGTAGITSTSPSLSRGSATPTSQG